MEVFPGDDFTSSDIEQMMSAIITAGLVIEYQGLDGKQYWAVTGWEKHQKVEKPNYKHPAPPKIADQSPTNRRQFADNSTTEGKGGEGRGRELELEGRGGEFDETQPARPEDSSNEKETPPNTPPSNAFAKIRNAIQQWQDADGGEALRKITSDQKYLGPIEPEITRFISHNLSKDPYRERITRAPLDFFLEQFPGWLCLPAAQRASKAQTNGSSPPNGAYTKPVQRGGDADQHMSREDALSLIRQHAGEYAGQFTESHICNIRSKTTQRTAVDMIEAIVNTLKNGHSPPNGGNAHQVTLPEHLKISTA